jgi:hypothetical protein
MLEIQQDENSQSIQLEGVVNCPAADARDRQQRVESTR